MVKAVKRKDATKKGPTELQKESPFTKKYGKVLLLIILGLIVAGFTLQGPMSSGNINRSAAESAEEDAVVDLGYGIGVPKGPQEGVVGSVSEYSAIFGQLEAPQSLSSVLDGDLFLIDNGVTQLILTAASTDSIEEYSKGSFITYKIASCGDFDCMITDEINGSAMFQTYALDSDSEFLTTKTIGLPIDT